MFKDIFSLTVATSIYRHLLNELGAYGKQYLLVNKLWTIKNAIIVIYKISRFGVRINLFIFGLCVVWHINHNRTGSKSIDCYNIYIIFQICSYMLQNSPSLRLSDCLDGIEAMIAQW